MAAPWEIAGLIPFAIPTPFMVGPVNVFLMKGEPITLIDNGVCSDEAQAALEGHLREHGLGLGDIQRVILTHHHVDHTGLTARIVAAGGAEVWGHPDLDAQARLNHSHDDDQRLFFVHILAEFGVPKDTAEQTMQLWDLFKTYSELFAVDHVFEDGGRVGPFNVHFVPGHSTTDTLFIHRAAGFSIVGDHILTSINPNPLLRRPKPGQARTKALVEYQDSLRRSRAKSLGPCLPGHGAPMPDAIPVIDGILAQHDRRIKRVLDALGPEGITPYAACNLLYPELALPHLYLGLSVATGILELIEHRGILRSELRDGTIHYARS